MYKKQIKRMIEMNWEQLKKQFSEEDTLLELYENRLSFQTLSSKMQCFFLEKDYGLQIEMRAKGEKITEKEMMAFFRFFQSKTKDQPFIFYMKHPVLNVEWFSVVKTCLNKIGMKEITIDETPAAKLVKAYSTFSNVYGNPETIKKLEFFQAYLEKINEIVEKNNKDKILFYGSKNDLSMRHPDKIVINNLYHFFVIGLIREKNNFLLTVFDYHNKEIKKQWTIEQEKQIEDYLQSYIDETEKKQRVKVLFEKHTYFFNQYCVENGIRKDISENLYTMLLSCFDEKEIEKIAANFIKNIQEKREKKDCYLYFFDTKVISIHKQSKEITILETERKNEHEKRRIN